MSAANALNFDCSDRPGLDYKMIELEFKQTTFQTFEMECQALCLSDKKCRAWDKPGVQGHKARCYLKDQTQSRRKNTCCVAGLEEHCRTGD